MERIPTAPASTTVLELASSCSDSSDLSHLHQSKPSRLMLVSLSATRSPFRTLRKRLFTEDTIPVQNTAHDSRNSNNNNYHISFSRTNSNSSSHRASDESLSFRMTPDDPNSTPYTMRSDENPFETVNDDTWSGVVVASAAPAAADACGDDHSILSSISNDSTRRMTTAAMMMTPSHAAAYDANRPPPGEIFVRSRSSVTEKSDDTDLLSPTATPAAGADTNNHLIYHQQSSNWQSAWVEGGGGGGGTAAASAPSTMRPSPVVTTSRSGSRDSDPAISAASATDNNYRLDAPKNEHLYKTSTRPLSLYKASAPGAITTTLPTTQRDRVKEQRATDYKAVVVTNTPSPKTELHRVNTDTTAPTATTMNTSPRTYRAAPLKADPPATTTTREQFVFRPLMKRACTANAALTVGVGAAAVRKPTLHPRSRSVANSSIKSAQMDSSQFSAASSQVSSSQLLMGDRPRRKQVQGSASVFSFGSIVGQSSFLTPIGTTAATVSEGNTTSSPTTAKEFVQLVKANKRLNQHLLVDDDALFISQSDRRHKSGFQQDFEFMWKQIRRLTGTEERLDLQRNKIGCLT